MIEGSALRVADVTVAGLPMRIRTSSDSPLEQPLLGGPLIFAAIGAAMVGARIRLIGPLPGDLTETDRTLLSALSPNWEVESPSPIPLPALLWVGPALVGDTPGLARVEGNPSLWRARCRPWVASESVLAIANSDPAAALDVMKAAAADLSLVDFSADWFRVRALETLECSSLADVVTVTTRDIQQLPSLASARLRRKTVVVKDGARGVTVVTGDRSQWLAAPTIQTRVLTDVGAGDLLLGCLAGAIAKQVTPKQAEAVDLHTLTCEAYAQTRHAVGQLLESTSYAEFARKVGYLNSPRSSAESRRTLV